MSKDLFGTLVKGAVPKAVGKVFFVSDSTGALWNDLNLRYPADADGLTRVHTSITLALAQCTSGQGDMIVLAPDFTTAPTSTELTNAITKGVNIVPAGKTRQGVWYAEKAAASLPQSARSSLFTVNGRVKILSIIGEVTTKVQDQACNLILSAENDGLNNSATALTSVALAAATNFASEAVGVIVGMTGTFANSLVTSHSAAAIQANPFVMRKGTIKLQTSASNTGALKWRVEYEPLEAGALIVAA